MSKRSLGGCAADGASIQLGPGLSRVTSGGQPPLHAAGVAGQWRARARNACGDVAAVVVGYRYLILAVIALFIIVTFLAFHPHVDLLQGAFGGAPKKPGNAGTTNSDGADSVNLANDVGQLTTDAAYVLVPSVSLAGAVGSIFWALGHRRGPSIVGGAVIAGVVGVGMDVIVK